MFAARVCISTGCPGWAEAHPGILGWPRPQFPSVLLCASDLYSPPAACLAGDLPSPDGMTLGGDARLTGGQELFPNSVTAIQARRCAYLPRPFRAQACSTH